MYANFILDSARIKTPSTFKIEKYLVTNMERIADGSMTGDIIAKKRKFYFTYEAITASELNNILDILWESESLFHNLSYVEDNIGKTATVYVGSIPASLHRSNGEWVWKDVNFNLIEK